MWIIMQEYKVKSYTQTWTLKEEKIHKNEHANNTIPHDIFTHGNYVYSRFHLFFMFHFWFFFCLPLHSCILKYIIMSHSHEFSMTLSDDWNKKKLLLFVQVLSSFMLSLSAVVMSYMQSPTSLMSQISLWDYLQNLINEWNKNNKITVIACIYLHI